MSIFPTLVELAGLPALPLCPANSTLTKLCTEGRSLAPLLQGGTLPARPATSQWPGKHAVGYTLRVDKYRYTEWLNYSGGNSGSDSDSDGFAPQPDWGRRVATELYLHGGGEGGGGGGAQSGLEDVNVAGQPEYRVIEAQLRAQLHAARPTGAE